MLLSALFCIFILFASLALASPPGSPQSQQSSTSELLIDNPHSEYFRHSPSLHHEPSMGRNAVTQTENDKKAKSKSPSPSDELLIDNPHSEYFHHSPTLRTAPLHAKRHTEDDRKAASRSRSPSMPREIREHKPTVHSAEIQHRLMTDHSSDYYHYVRLLAPKEHLNVNSLARERGKKRTTSSQSVTQPVGELERPRTRRKRKSLNVEEKAEKNGQKSNLSDRRKNTISGDHATVFSSKHNRAVSDWRIRKKAQDPNYFKAKYHILKWRERLEDQLGVKVPREKGGRPRKIAEQKPSSKKSKKSN